MLVQDVRDIFGSPIYRFVPSSSIGNHSTVILNYFKQLPAGQKLSQADIDFLTSRFEARWNDILGNISHDYTFSNKLDSNAAETAKWVELAVELAKETGVNYFQILMPTLTNLEDFNADLLEKSLNSFSHDDTGKFLYYKSHLFDSMLTKDSNSDFFQLAIPLSIKADRPCTLQELRSLSFLPPEFTLDPLLLDDDTDSNASPWQILKDKVVLDLDKQGQIPEELLPDLVEVIEYYYFLKSTKSDYIAFQYVLKNCFSKFIDYDVTNINCLYGKKIEYKGQNTCLLDLFFALYDADSFVIDNEIKLLSDFLVAFDPILQPDHSRLNKQYHEQLNERNKVSAYTDCGRLLVSLFRTEFPHSDLKIGAWDITNKIPAQLKLIYDKLLAVICAQADVPEESVCKVTLADIKTVVAEFITYHDEQFTNIPKDWLIAVAEEQFSTIGGYWFEPEAIMEVMLALKVVSKVLQEQIHSFLDELIKTSNQDKLESNIKLRINMQFSKLLSDLSLSERNIVINELATVKDAKNSFHENCLRHIKNRVGDNDAPKAEVSPQFFPIISPQRLPESVKTLSELFTYYLLVCPKLLCDIVRKYLSALAEPILSADDNKNIEASSYAGITLGNGAY